MKILLIDNYDSFTYNLYHYLSILKCNVEVYRNDKIKIEKIKKNNYKKIVISPGPGNPDQTGNCLNIVRHFYKTIPILGVCLGHQAISEVYGSKLYNMPEVLHGVSSQVKVTEKGDRLFKDIPEEYTICHYHSWNVDKANLGEDLLITAVDEFGEIMAISHKEYDVKGVQFHPESIMTEHGHQLLRNWVS